MTICKYRTIWLSDIHLGTKGCQADKLLKFLQSTESEYIILVGDIIDFWAMKRNVYWPVTHSAIVQQILHKVRSGTTVIFVPGNHDENLREYDGLTIGDIQLQKQYVHTLADGRKALCIHGDEFDIVTRYHKWIAVLGDIGYSALLYINRHFNKVRQALGMGYWSLSQFIKHQVKQAVNFIGDFERNVAKEAVSQNVDVVVCGHIHHAEISTHEGVLYVNCGDWVESCTAIVEDEQGNLSVVGFFDDEVVSLIHHTSDNNTVQRVQQP